MPDGRSVHVSQPHHQQPGPRGERAEGALHDRELNYQRASKYDAMRRDEGFTEGRVKGRNEGRAQASECAAQIVETMPLIGGRKRTAAQIRDTCS